MKCKYTPLILSIISIALSLGTLIYMCHEGGCFGIQNINFGDASVTALEIIITILIGWNIYHAIEDKEKIKKEVLEDVDKELAGSQYKFYKSFMTEEIILANIYMKSGDWENALSFLSLMGKRYELITKSYNKVIDISMYVETIKIFIEKIEGEFIHNNNLHGFMKGVFYPLAKYNDSVLDVYKLYKDKDKVGRTPKTQPEFMEENTAEAI